jgi:hypothetical protein
MDIIYKILTLRDWNSKKLKKVMVGKNRQE